MVPNSNRDFTAEVFYLSTCAGPLAAIYYKPNSGHRGDLLYVHPFAHELYNSRPITASFWRYLAARGTGVLAFDLLGCGDSSGDFAEARWNIWTESVVEGIRWLQKKSGRPIDLCGLRLGAALALDAAALCSETFRHALLLQPVVKGEEMLTQFIRLRVAFSGMREIPEKRETTQDIRYRLAKGAPLEIAGYTIAPELASAIDAVDLAQCRASHFDRTIWIESQLTVGGSECLRQEFHSVSCKPLWLHTRGEVRDYEAFTSLLSASVLKNAFDRNGQ